MKINKEAIMIAKHIECFLREYAPNHKTDSTNTLKAYTMTLKLYLMFLEVEKEITPLSMTIDCFNRITIEEWLVWLKNKRNVKSQTCNNRLSSLRVFLEYASSREITMQSVYIESSTIPLRKTIKTKINGMSKEAIKTLFSIVDINTKTGRRDITVLILMYNTATRISEVLNLKIKNIYLDIKTPYIIVLGKGNKLRSLYLLPKTVEYLKAYIKEAHGENPDLESYLFYSRNSGPQKPIHSETIRKRMKKYCIDAHEICKEVPLNLHPHQIRHAVASHWLEDGMNIVQISLLLGHEQLETTMKYIDTTLKQEAVALAILERDDKTTSKVWKNDDCGLLKFCGLNK